MQLAIKAHHFQFELIQVPWKNLSRVGELACGGSQADSFFWPFLYIFSLPDPLGGEKSSWCIFWRTEFSGIKKCSWQHDTRLTATITTYKKRCKTCLRKTLSPYECSNQLCCVGEIAMGLSLRTWWIVLTRDAVCNTSSPILKERHYVISFTFEPAELGR